MAGAVRHLRCRDRSFSPAAATPAAAKSRYTAKVIDLRRPLADHRPCSGRSKSISGPKPYSELAERDADRRQCIPLRRNYGIPQLRGRRGRGAYEDALQFIAAWSGFVGRAADCVLPRWKGRGHRARKGQEENCRHHGLQNADEFREPKDVKAILRIGIALRAAHL